MHRPAENYMQGINMYVPAMQYASSLVHGQPSAFSLGMPAVADNDIINATLPANSAAGTLAALTWVSDVPYGRAVSMNANADPGGNTVIELQGEDYLGQPMLERYTLATGGVTQVNGKKAFYRLLAAKMITPGVNAVTADIGILNILGLPFKGHIDWAKEDGAPVPALTGITLVAPVLTDPATAVTGDPRGTYTPAMTPNGVKEIIIGLQGDNWVNPAGNGGLHGIRHYFA